MRHQVLAELLRYWPGGGEGGPERRNVVLIVVDSVRKKEEVRAVLVYGRLEEVDQIALR